MLLKKTLQYYFLSTFWKSSVEARLAGFGFWVVGDVLSGLGRVPQPHCAPFLPIPLSRNDCEEENAVRHVSAYNNAQQLPRKSSKS